MVEHFDIDCFKWSEVTVKSSGVTVEQCSDRVM